MSIRPRWHSISVVPTLALILYLAFPSQQYDYDVLPELIRIERGILRFGDPAHPLYTWVGWLWYSAWKFFGYAKDAMWPMQVLNAICASLALLVFQLTLVRLGINRTAATLATLGAGLSYSYWLHTVDAFFIIPAALCALGALYFAVLEAESPSPRTVAVVAGLAVGIGTLFYQVNLLLLPALFIAIYRPLRPTWNWAIGCVLMSVTALGVAGTGWLLQAMSAENITSARDFFAWLTGAHGGMDTGLWRRDGVPLVSTTIKAWVATIVPLYEGLRLRDLLQGQISITHVPGQLSLLLLVLATLGIVVTGVVRLRQGALGGAHARRLAALVGLWFLLSGCTVVWFDRAEVKLWLIPMFAFWMTFALALNYWLDAVRRQKATMWLVASATVFLLSIAVSNFLLAILPDASVTPSELKAARALAREMQPDDLAISATADWILYVQYLCSDCRIIYVMDSAQRLGKAQHSSIDRIIDEEVSRTLARSGRVFVPDYFAKGDDPAWTVWVEPFTGLTPAQFAQFEYPVAMELDGVVIRQLRRPAGSN